MLEAAAGNTRDVHTGPGWEQDEAAAVAEEPAVASRPRGRHCQTCLEPTGDPWLLGLVTRSCVFLRETMDRTVGSIVQHPEPRSRAPG